MAGFNDEQLAALRAPLARDHVKSRQQAGRTLSYIEGWVVIAEANRIFGFDGWDRETVETRCVTEVEVMMGANKDRPGWRVAYVGRVRVTVRAGDMVIVREGTGYGSGIDADLGQAHESAVKECETDAAKRGLMTFGNPFGLALYDKTQAEVEPIAGRRPAPQKPADDPLTPPTQSAPPNGRGTPAHRSADPDRATNHARAVEIRDRLKLAIDNAAEPRVLDEIMKINAADLAFIEEFHEPTHAALMRRALARSQELLGSA